MFERNKNKTVVSPAETSFEPVTSSATTTPEPTSMRTTAMIGPSITIKGTVTGDEDLIVQGKVEGSIELNDHEVSVGSSGQVTADINARVIRIDGEVSGDVSGNEKVVISKSGNVRGNIVAPRVTLEDGAVFKGSIDMDPGDKGAASKTRGPSNPAIQSVAADAEPDLELKSG